jgi:hypothetical protein
VGSLSNSLDKYSAASAPFGRKLVFNEAGWAGSRMEDMLAARFLYPDRQGLLPD